MKPKHSVWICEQVLWQSTVPNPDGLITNCDAGKSLPPVYRERSALKHRGNTSSTLEPNNEAPATVFDLCGVFVL